MSRSMGFVKKDKVPETVIGEEGTAKRNIIRKAGTSGGSGGGPRKESAAGLIVDDGSTYHDPAALDYHDPNYDSEEDRGIVYMPFASALRASVGKSTITLTTYKKIVEPLISSYFIHSDVDEILRSLNELGSETSGYSYELVKRAINMSFDKSDRERELVSKLLSSAYPEILSSNAVGKGFERLFELMDEIELDCPLAREMLATFLTRAVADEILPPSFLGDAVVCNLGGDVVEKAKRVLSRDHGGAIIEKGWGPGDGRPVEEMKVAVDQLLLEYLVSGDLDEASRCIVELHSPLFYHEVVKRCVVHSLDVSDAQQLKMSELLAYLVERDQLTEAQAVKGFNRLFSLQEDLELDTPSAGRVMAAFMERAKADGVLPATYTRPLGLVVPQKS